MGVCVCACPTGVGPDSMLQWSPRGGVMDEKWATETEGERERAGNSSRETKSSFAQSSQRGAVLAVVECGCPMAKTQMREETAPKYASLAIQEERSGQTILAF